MIADEAIILAGGRGTRLRPVVGDVPKPLAPVAGRPFLAWVLDRLAGAGVRRCILATGYRAEMVRAAIGGDWNGMQIDFSVEDRALGTGGAVARAAGMLHGGGAHVLNGDTYLEYAPAGLQAAAERVQADVAIALAHVPDVARYGAADIAQGRVLAFSEKGGQGSGWINAGCYYLARSLLDELPRDRAFSLEQDVLAPAIAAGESVAAFVETDRFIDIGVPDDYARAQRHFDTRSA